MGGDGASVLTKESPKSTRAPSAREDTAGRLLSTSQEEHSHQTESASTLNLDFPQWLSGKRICLQCRRHSEDLGVIHGLERAPGEGNGTPLQYSCLENPRDGGACWVLSMGSHRVGHD